LTEMLLLSKNFI